MKEYDSAEGNLLAARNFPIPGILLNILQCCHHIQNSCTFLYPIQLEYAPICHPSQYFLVPIMTVIYKTVSRLQILSINK
jgi:hypothetical protein